MNTQSTADWLNEFGIDVVHMPGFYVSKQEIDEKASLGAYAHVVRRAFDLLQLDGVWCDQNVPLVYFKLVEQADTLMLTEMHRLFWNHGGAAILVVITPFEVQVYSGLAIPHAENDSDRVPGFVTSIARASQALKEFLTSVGSGEFFHKHTKSFDTSQRVDQSLLKNLQATRDQLTSINTKKESDQDLDAFLCRLVFTSYLFDREIIGTRYVQEIGLPPLAHLRDILALRPRTTAKDYLYRLFNKLAEDFNGDLFNDDLYTEASKLTDTHLEIIENFFTGTDMLTGQKSIWPYDFGVIPIETISAIYERFLRPTEKKQGAFYTPRYLAELVLDIALSDRKSLLGLRFLDPACGSGIFLVGIFNRIAEEWQRENPNASNSQRARELIQILQSNISGIDVNPTACRITAFSLYLAYLDQLTPRDIQDLQLKGNALPQLVIRSKQEDRVGLSSGIWIGDFFDSVDGYPTNVDVVIGNPPWGNIADESSHAFRWCHEFELGIPDKQIAAAFMWKSANHVTDTGRVCLLLPHGILFNHKKTALDFQKEFISHHQLDVVLNLTDYQSFLFSRAKHPALVMSYRKTIPDKDHVIEYWSPKADWKVTKAEIISISEGDRTRLSTVSILNDLNKPDAPQIWKRLAWATSRDRRLLDRMTDLPRLRDRVRTAKQKRSEKPWLIADGFEPLGPSDNPKKAVVLNLPSNLVIETTASNLDLFILPSDCTQLPDDQITVRNRSNKTTRVFFAPHVLITHGAGNVAFADFPVSFKHGMRGINGPVQDRSLLVFLAAYLRSSLAKYLMFQLSTNWGVSRKKVHLEELLRLPFPLPIHTSDPVRAKNIIEEVNALVSDAMKNAEDYWVDRSVLVDNAQEKIDILIFEYFDILPSERILVEDAINVTIPSFRPSSQRQSIPAIRPSSTETMDKYTKQLCSTLSSWSERSGSHVVGKSMRSVAMGVGLVLLKKVSSADSALSIEDNGDILKVLNQLREASSIRINTFELMRGLKVFHGEYLYILKPLGHRYWTETAALNDADEVAGSILMKSPRELV